LSLSGAPAAYEEYDYRVWLYYQWLAEAAAAREALANINDSPYYEPGVYRFTLQLLRQYWQQYRA
jgi:hypothetical protein